ncbi:unnamed protein product [Cylindrotheca closterium]|uniref:Uncharacterized protein n=1 Tax=Cylindrotheca closterium TaxID=2856 RepID=A0AAD2GD90_9STRA|nr:unnamed protein product [Cylindrotheca closterium]
MLSLRSIIMIFLLLAMQPMAMPSLMSANYTRPSIQVYSLANEDIVSTVDFVGTTVEMESTGVPSFSLAEFIMSIDYESVKAFAQDFSKKYEAFAEAFTDAMSAIFEFFSMEYNAYKQSINYESIKAFAQDFIEKYEAFIQAFTNAMSAIFEHEAFHQPIDYESVMSSTEAYIQEVSTAMFSKIELFIPKFEAYNQEFQVEYQRIYKKLENVATDLLVAEASASAWPSLLDPEFIVRDIFDGVESYTTKDPFAPTPVPPLLSLEDAQAIAAMDVVLDSSTTFGGMVIALLLVATVTTVIFAGSVIDQGLVSMEDLSIVLETPCLSMTDLRKKMTPSVILCSADAYARYQASCDKSKDPSIVDLCNLFANISFRKDTTDPSKKESF